MGEDHSIKNCALEELNLWMVSWDIPETERQWLLEWANRRAENVIEFIAEPMKDIAAMHPGVWSCGSPNWKQSFESTKLIAKRALKTCALSSREKP